jgi:hypothetical protein
MKGDLTMKKEITLKEQIKNIWYDISENVVSGKKDRTVKQKEIVEAILSYIKENELNLGVSQKEITEVIKTEVAPAEVYRY